MTPIENQVQTLASLAAAQKQARLNELFAVRTEEPSVLQWRAELVTALRLAKVWPV